MYKSWFNEDYFPGQQEISGYSLPSPAMVKEKPETAMQIPNNETINLAYVN